MHANRLIHEKSPYLLQHAHNPVDWYPWGDDAFRKAREEDKPVFLSVGYSTCHWCHVMERESFEDQEIAALLNRHFVSIKVDREERPDVDRIYMTFVQAATGSGGWPMSVFLTPELKPFLGGTYFPPDDRGGQLGLRYLLERIAEAWRLDREKIVASSSTVLKQLRRYAEAAPAAARLDELVLEAGFNVFRRGFDPLHGGFGGAPKFPQPSVLHFLFRYHHYRCNREALDMALATLLRMALGGIHDHLGGGFHRYSVDERWFVPHFEKMLYDQAQLAIAYLEAFQVTGEQFYAEVARRTLDYVLRDLTHDEGGFYSAEDADSAIDPAHPGAKREGAFYVWTRTEIEQALGQPEGEWFCHHCGVAGKGNVHDDPHGEFAGQNILHEAREVEETAAHAGRPVEEVHAALREGRQKLLAERSKRMRPHRDDKILTAWNGLMISAFAKAGQVLEEPRYLEAARRARDFIVQHLSAGERLLRRYRDGEATIPAFLDDYAFFVQGLLDLHEAHDQDLAVKLTETQIELFEDKENGGFFSTAAGDGNLVLRMKDDHDGAEPSGNSVAVLNLLRLAEMTGRQDFRQAAERTLGAFAWRLSNAPESLPAMLAAFGSAGAPSCRI
ncbi:MAG: thioredoxin domain-containing protein [Acidobacteriota bacterium]